MWLTLIVIAGLDPAIQSTRIADGSAEGMPGSSPGMTE
jgi:hypothetical protein